MVEGIPSSGFILQHDINHEFKDGTRFRDITKIVGDSKALSLLRKDDIAAIQIAIFSLDQKADTTMKALSKQHNFSVVDKATIYDEEHQINDGEKTQSTQNVKEATNALLEALNDIKQIYDRIQPFLKKLPNASSENPPQPPPATRSIAPQQPSGMTTVTPRPSAAAVQPSSSKQDDEVQQLLNEITPLLEDSAIALTNRKSKAKGVIERINQYLLNTPKSQENAKLKALRDALEKLEVRLLLDQTDALVVAYSLLGSNPEETKLKLFRNEKTRLIGEINTILRQGSLLKDSQTRLNTALRKLRRLSIK